MRTKKNNRLARILLAATMATTLTLAPVMPAISAAFTSWNIRVAEAQEVVREGDLAASSDTSASAADAADEVPAAQSESLEKAEGDESQGAASGEIDGKSAAAENMPSGSPRVVRSVWPRYSSTCINTRTHQHYSSIYEALTDTVYPVRSDDVIEMIAANDFETKTIDIPANMRITITTADGVDSSTISFHTSKKNGDPLFLVHAGATLTIDGTKNGQNGSEHNGIILDGSTSKGVRGIQVGTANDAEARLELTDVTVQNFDAANQLDINKDRYAAGISVYCSAATLAGTTLVSACTSSYVGNSVYHKTAGGVAVVGSGTARTPNTATLEMGKDATVSECVGETGGITVNGGGYAHIQGSVTDNKTVSTGVSYHCAGGIYIGGVKGSGYPSTYDEDPAMTGLGGNVLIEGAFITNNKSLPSNDDAYHPSAGGVFIDAGRLTIHGATITGNNTISFGRNSGGGVAMNEERITDGIRWQNTTMISGLTLSGKVIAKDNTVGVGANIFRSNINISSDLALGTQVLRIDGDLTPDSYVGIAATMGNRMGPRSTFPTWPSKSIWRGTFADDVVPLRSYPGVEFAAAVSSNPDENSDIYLTANASPRYTRPGNLTYPADPDAIAHCPNPDFPYSTSTLDTQSVKYDRNSYNGRYSGDARQIANLHTLVNDFDENLSAVAAPENFVPFMHDYNHTGYVKGRSDQSTAYSPGYPVTSPYGTAAIIWGYNGTLKVTKELAADADSPYSVDREFSFTVKTSTTDGSTPSSYRGFIYNADNTSTGTSVTATPQGEEFKLRNGQYLLFGGLPTGEVGQEQTRQITVTETDGTSTAGSDPTRTFATTVAEANDLGNAGSNSSGEAAWTGFPTYQDKTNEVTFTNKLRTGSLSVTKVVTNLPENTTAPSFNLTLTVTLPAGVMADASNSYEASLTQGAGASAAVTPEVRVGASSALIYTASITDGSVLTIPNLPVGSTYVLLEDGSDTYRASAIVRTLNADGNAVSDTHSSGVGQSLRLSYAENPEGDAGEIDKARIAYVDNAAAQDIPNRVELTNIRALGSLHISQETTGALANLDGEFDVTVILSLPDGCTLPADYAATKTDSSAAGNAAATSAVQAEYGTPYTFKAKLANGDSLDFNDVPEGTTYTIVEDGVDGYTASAAVSTANAQAETITGVRGQGVTAHYDQTSDTAVGRTKNAIIALTSAQGGESPNKVQLTSVMASVPITGLTLFGSAGMSILATVGVLVAIAAGTYIVCRRIRS
ncbi:DUF5979 domain-containing protein [Collinsella sp. AGMB00827]|uniref:DUF5979 domain-containing protein n=1 Tax=Collinsella ureilytica TaxID=2869515 RepID=A0ABS7MII5_9ACTN|nr:DUF5979 domain-containing protein [Collinsella urealyticum]MBY4797128.1 DUF5979 domain-containing protein [Collinsella urealyticum]